MINKYLKINFKSWNVGSQMFCSLSQNTKTGGLSFIVIIFTAILVMFLPARVFAGLGISPADIVNHRLHPGQVYSYTFYISRSDPEEKLNIVVDPDTPVDNWIEIFPSRKFVVEKGVKKQNFNIIIKVPTDAENNSYKGQVYIKAIPEKLSEEQITIAEGGSINFNIRVTDEGIKDLLIRNIKIENIYIDNPLELSLLVENKGNVEDYIEKLELEISSLEKENLQQLTLADFKKLAPGETLEIKKELSGLKLGVGEYLAEVKVYSDNEVISQDEILYKILLVEDDKIEKDMPGQISFSIPINYFAIIILILAGTFFLSFRKKSRKSLLIGLVLLIGLSSSYFLYKTNKHDGSVPLETQDSQIKGAIGEDAKGGIFSLEPYSYVRNGKKIYPVYERPSLDSKVIYEAEDQGGMEIIEEKATWYRISIKHKADGWLPKSNIDRL